MSGGHDTQEIGIDDLDFGFDLEIDAAKLAAGVVENPDAEGEAPDAPPEFGDEDAPPEAPFDLDDVEVPTALGAATLDDDVLPEEAFLLSGGGAFPPPTAAPHAPFEFDDVALPGDDTAAVQTGEDDVLAGFGPEPATADEAPAEAAEAAGALDFFDTPDESSGTASEAVPAFPADFDGDGLPAFPSELDGDALASIAPQPPPEPVWSELYGLVVEVLHPGSSDQPWRAIVRTPNSDIPVHVHAAVSPGHGVGDVFAGCGWLTERPPTEDDLPHDFALSADDAEARLSLLGATGPVAWSLSASQTPSGVPGEIPAQLGMATISSALQFGSAIGVTRSRAAEDPALDWVLRRFCVPEAAILLDRPTLVVAPGALMAPDARKADLGALRAAGRLSTVLFDRQVVAAAALPEGFAPDDDAQGPALIVPFDPLQAGVLGALEMAGRPAGFRPQEVPAPEARARISAAHELARLHLGALGDDLGAAGPHVVDAFSDAVALIAHVADSGDIRSAYAWARARSLAALSDRPGARLTGPACLAAIRVGRSLRANRKGLEVPIAEVLRSAAGVAEQYAIKRPEAVSEVRRLMAARNPLWPMLGRADMQLLIRECADRVAGRKPALVAAEIGRVFGAAASAIRGFHTPLELMRTTTASEATALYLEDLSATAVRLDATGIGIASSALLARASWQARKVEVRALRAVRQADQAGLERGLPTLAKAVTALRARAAHRLPREALPRLLTPVIRRGEGAVASLLRGTASGLNAAGQAYLRRPRTPADIEADLQGRARRGSRAAVASARKGRMSGTKTEGGVEGQLPSGSVSVEADAPPEQNPFEMPVERRLTTLADLLKKSARAVAEAARAKAVARSLRIDQASWRETVALLGGAGAAIEVIRATATADDQPLSPEGVDELARLTDPDALARRRHELWGAGEAFGRNADMATFDSSFSMAPGGLFGPDGAPTPGLADGPPGTEAAPAGPSLEDAIMADLGFDAPEAGPPPASPAPNEPDPDEETFSFG